MIFVDWVRTAVDCMDCSRLQSVWCTIFFWTAKIQSSPVRGFRTDGLDYVEHCSSWRLFCFAEEEEEAGAQRWLASARRRAAGDGMLD